MYNDDGGCRDEQSEYFNVYRKAKITDEPYKVKDGVYRVLSFNETYERMVAHKEELEKAFKTKDVYWVM